MNHGKTVTILAQFGMYDEKYQCSRCLNIAAVFMVENSSFDGEVMCASCIKEKYRHSHIVGMDNHPYVFPAVQEEHENPRRMVAK